jgi:hypothetical protein
MGSSCDSTKTRRDEGLLYSGDEMNMESAASMAGLGCVKGTTLALAAEACAALFFYGIWQLWHLFS